MQLVRSVVALAVAGCGGAPPPRPPPLVIAHADMPAACPAPPAQSYETVKVTRGEVTATITTTALLAPQTVVRVGNLNAGHIMELYVDANSPVTKGQLLARLDTRNEVIAAPLTGVVLERRVEVGQVATSGATLFEIASPLTRLKLDAPIDEADIARLIPGQPTEFSVEAYRDRRYLGTLRMINNVPHPGAHGSTYDVTIDVDNAELALRPGMTAAIAIKTDTRNDVLVVPTAALAFRASAGGAPTVWVVHGSVLTPIAVRPGITNGVVTEVRAGDVHDGDDVAIGQRQP